jgi:cellulose synthase/poly-beta-1,6-N-acetylglucosamine synthase-like glycosyltransferase/CheY-like chemotaxis protein
VEGSILLVEDDPDLALLVRLHLEQAGYAVTHAEDGSAALEQLSVARPDLVLSDIMMPNMDGLTFLKHLRADPLLRTVPVVLLTTKSQSAEIVTGFELGADDYVIKPFRAEELLARVSAKIHRPPVPADQLPYDRPSGLMSEAGFAAETEREYSRALRGRKPGTIACLLFNELPRLRSRLGSGIDNVLGLQIGRVMAADGDPLVSYGRARDGSFWLLLPEVGAEEGRARLASLAQAIASNRFAVGDERVRLTPSVGYLAFSDSESAEALMPNARIAAEHAAVHLDLQPARFTRGMVEEAVARRRLLPGALIRPIEKLRLPLQMAATFLIAWLVPLALYFGAGALGFDLSWPVYIVVVVMIVVTALFIWMEGVLALRRIDPPPAPSYPRASAVIAAYLPNEAATLESTIEAFLRLDYPSEVQVILAYNTPNPMPFENLLKELGERHPSFIPLKVEGSTSKAQNVNAALSLVSGEFIGVFDADHQPDPNSFRRAWDWLASGYDVVQGHCFIRNGDASWIARTVAIEFEQIYAVAHPGRWRLHGFGIFGGSNGYWKADLLRSIRMHGFMLTEDIDSSLRVIENGGKIASDPHLISRELSPTDLKGLTNQRLRWAQGWFQVSLKRFGPLMRSRHLTVRNKLGAFQLLIWREVFPWISLQIFPIVAYWAWLEGGLDQLNWFVPILLVLTAATLATGPGQILFTWMLADRAHRKHPGWFVSYLVTSFFFYAEYKNLLSRVAQIKEALKERAWKVTPRSAA